MKAICVTPGRALEVRDVSAPGEPPPGHVLVEMAASAINHGDKTFLTRPLATGAYVPGSRLDVWGASGAGHVAATGLGVPSDAAGRAVAVYRSLNRSPDTVGLWCETAIVPWTSCLALPAHVRPRDYCGSLVNVMTAYAFLAQAAAEGHKGVVVTAGSSATGLALASLAARRGTLALFLVRSEAVRTSLRERGVAHVIATAKDGFEHEFARLAAELGATAVFDGVGGDLLTRVAPHLPLDSTIYVYGFLGGAAPVAFPTALVMMKSLTIRRFSNFESATVSDKAKLAAALKELEGVIDDPMFATRVGREFGFGEVDEAMGYEAAPGAKAVLVP